jgi:hypothetical protein
MYVVHHFQEEEDELFPRIRASRIDLAALETRIRARRRELEMEGRPDCRADAA